MTLVRLGPGQFRDMPWKNGRGSTTELLIEPPGATLASGFHWRLSMAAVAESGSFSRFPGVDRTLLLLEGNGMELDFGPHGRVELPGPLEPVVFSGDWTASARLLGGPCRDFNVMSERGRVEHGVTLLRPGPGPEPLPLAPTVLVYAAGGRAGVPGLEGGLGRGELLRIEGPGGPPPRVWAAEPGTVLVVVTIRPAGGGTGIRSFSPERLPEPPGWTPPPGPRDPPRR